MRILRQFVLSNLNLRTFRYIKALHTYLLSFTKRAQPLVDIESQQREAEALYKTQFAICGQNMGDALRYMGTTTVARDIDFIASRLDGPDSLMWVVNFLLGSVAGVADVRTVLQ